MLTVFPNRNSNLFEKMRSKLVICASTFFRESVIFIRPNRHRSSTLLPRTNDSRGRSTIDRILILTRVIRRVCRRDAKAVAWTWSTARFAYQSNPSNLAAPSAGGIFAYSLWLDTHCRTKLQLLALRQYEPESATLSNGSSPSFQAPAARCCRCFSI